MTLKTFSNRSKITLNMFGITLRQNSGILILACILALMICPGYIMTIIDSNTTYDGMLSYYSYVYRMDNTSRGLICVTTILTSLLAILMNAINFSFLYSKKAADVYHSAPLTRNEMFVSRFFAGIAVAVVPMVIIYASASALLGLDGVTGSLKLIVMGFVYNLLITLVCSAISMLFIVSSGTVFDFVLSFGGVGVGGALLGVVIILLCDKFLEGFSNGDSEIRNILCSVSPFIYCAYGAYDYLSGAPEFEWQNLRFLITAFIVAAVFFALSMVLYRRRKGEKAGSSYAYSFVYLICTLIISYIGAFGIGMIFSQGSTDLVFFIFALLGALLVSVVFGVISYRSFKTVKKSLILGGASYLALIATYVIVMTGAFGYTTHVPNLKTIESATVSSWNSNFEELRPEQVTKFHKAIVDRLDENEAIFREENIDSTGTHIDYVLKNGKTVSRYYNISNKLFAKDFLELYTSEEYRNQVKNFVPQGVTTSIVLYGNQDYAYHTVEIPPVDAKRIMEAFAKDMENATETSFIHTFETRNATVYCVEWAKQISQYSTKYGDFNLVVEPHYVNTKAVLEELDIENMFKAAYEEQLNVK